MMLPRSNTKCDRPTDGRQTAPRGFSLTELMISIGILAVGLVMAGALFPAAIKANSQSVSDVLGSIICENGLAITKARWASLTSNDFGTASAVKPLDKFVTVTGVGKPALVVLADDSPTDSLLPLGEPDNQFFLTRQGRAYPQGDETGEYGFVLLMRRMDEDLDPTTFEGYQIVVTSYRCRLAGGLVTYRTQGVSISSGKTTVVGGMGAQLCMGTPAIHNVTGAFVKMTQAHPSGVSGQLERPFPEEVEPVDRIWMVVEKDPLTGEQLRISPALATMSTRTGLTGRLNKSLLR